jgi:preprotein translocase subunit SecG
MTMNNILIYLQILVSIVLILMILVQNKGTGFGRVWGGTSSFTRRGLEKVIFKMTFVLTGLFVLLSLINIAL